MTRVIKFRAWDKEEQKMINHRLLEGNNPFDQWNNYGEGRFVWMQFSGLHDKNGKEIYEGDIVKKVIDKDNGYKDFYHESKCEVIFRDGCFMYREWEDGESGWEGYLKGREPMSDSTFEVIGNIYENPDLISTNET